MRKSMCFANARGIMLLLLVVALVRGASAADEGPTGIEVVSPAAGARLDGAGIRIEARCAPPASSGSPVYVTAVLRLPSGAEERVSLHDDGAFGDTSAGDGVFAALARSPREAGEYTVRVKSASGGLESWSEPVGFTFTPRETPWTLLIVLAVVCGALASAPAAWYISRRRSIPAAEQVSPPETPGASDEGALRAELARLRDDAESAAETAVTDERGRVFDSLAQMLVQLPSVRKAVADGAPVQAKDVLPMLGPLDSAVRSMGFAPIGSPGEEAAFDPRLHQMAGDEAAPEAGTPVRIVFVGFTRGDNIARKAQVARVQQ